MFKDSIFKKIQDKTNVDKNTIISLANKLQKSDMKDEKILSDLVDDISRLTGKEVSQDKKDKIIKTIINDKVPKDIDNII